MILPRIAIKMTHCPVVRLNHASSLYGILQVGLPLQSRDPSQLVGAIKMSDRLIRELMGLG